VRYGRANRGPQACPGRLEFSILFVVYTERYREDGEEIVRIISVRKAERHEVKQYCKGTFSWSAA